jgi:hypothetical protein
VFISGGVAAMNHQTAWIATTLGALLASVASCGSENRTIIMPPIPDAGGGQGSVPAPVQNPAPRAPDAGTGSGSEPAPIVGAGPDQMPAAGGCSGCLQLRVPGAEYADLQLQLGTTWDLSSSVIAWRVRVRDFAGEVSAVPYVQSGDRPDDEARPQSSTWNEPADWQQIQFDLGAAVPDGGSAAPGAASVVGGSFDATRVRRLGIAFQVGDAAGAATLEIDAVTFSEVPALNADFAASPSGFVLVDSSGVTLGHVPE